jgi:transposase
MGELLEQVGPDKSSLFDLGCSLDCRVKNIADGGLPDLTSKNTNSVRNSPYNSSKKTQEYAKSNGIILHYLPPYSPNLNSIERLWRVMNEFTRNNKFFTCPKEVRESISNFFANTWEIIAEKMRLRINDNFQTLPKSMFSS